MNISTEEAHRIIDSLAGLFYTDARVARELLQSKLQEPVHTDHHVRHHDRTCPACQEDVEPSEALQLVHKQAEDEGLWFEAMTAPEAYLQSALRKLHAAIEARCKC